MKTNEITEELKAKIASFKKEVSVEETGVVISVVDGVARVYGLTNVFVNELIELPNGVFGMALNLLEDEVGCILFGDEKLIKQGDIAKRTKKTIEVPVGDELIGRIMTRSGMRLMARKTLQLQSRGL